MRGVEVIENPATAAVALDPIRAQLLAELAESPASARHRAHQSLRSSTWRTSHRLAPMLITSSLLGHKAQSVSTSSGSDPDR